jgi:hypothetical protein
MDDKSEVVGEVFRPGEVWMTGRGFLHRVMGYVTKEGYEKKQVVLRGGSHGQGRRKLRDWDAVSGWTLHALPERQNAEHVAQA